MAGILTAAVASTFSGVTADPYFEYTTLLLPGNGTNGAQNNTFLDGSTNNFTITRNGQTTQGTFSPFSQTGWGNYFNGSSGFAYADNTNLEPGSGDFTLEVWVFHTAAIGSESFYYYQPSSGIGISRNASGKVQINQSGIATILTSTGSVNSNQWVHVAVVRSGSGSNNLKVYIDGNADATTATSTTNFAGTGSIDVGKAASGSYMTGYFSNLRFCKAAVYTSNFTPSTSPLTTTSQGASNCNLLICQSNRFKDNSSNDFSPTISGSPSVQAFSPFNPSASWSAATYGGSGYFDGTGDYLTAPSNSVYNFSGDFTIEAWVYLLSFSQNNTIIDTRNGDVLGAYVFGVNTNQKLDFLFALSGTTRITSTNNVSLNTWTHVVVSRASGTLRLFINGNQEASTTTSAAINALSFPSIGGGRAGGTDVVNGYYLNGYINGLRVLNGTGYSTITVPTAPLTAITNTSLLLNFTNAGIYDATSKNDLETVGNAQISTAISAKWGTGSIYFNGTGNYLAIYTEPTKQNLNFGTGDFTIETWIYFTTVSGAQGIIDNSTSPTSGTTGQWYWYKTTSNTLQFGQGGVGNLLTTTGTVSATSWTHIAITRSGSTLRAFINGNLDSSVSNSTNFNNGNGVQVGLVAASTYLNAYLQDLRITKGYARYTANFTPPTSAFPTL